jgi:hypothetical protein
VKEKAKVGPVSGAKVGKRNPAAVTPMANDAPEISILQSADEAQGRADGASREADGAVGASFPATAAPGAASGARRPAGGSAPVARPQGGRRARCLAFRPGGFRCPSPAAGGRWGGRFLCAEHGRALFLVMCVESLTPSRRQALAEAPWETDDELQELMRITR